jgi:predicted Zn-dependent protease
MLRCIARQQIRLITIPIVLLALSHSLGCELVVSGDTLKRRAVNKELTLANTASSIGDYDTALEAYLRALDLANHLLKQESPKAIDIVLYVLDRVAFGSQYIGRYEECERSSRESLSHRDEQGGNYLRATVVSLNLLAPCVARLGRIEEAQALHARLVDEYKPRAEPHDIFLATSYREIGDALMSQGETEAALVHFESALKVRLWSERSNRFDIATNYNSYAKALRKLGRTVDADAAEANAAKILEGSDYYREVLYEGPNVVQAWPDEPVRVHVMRVQKKHYSKTRALTRTTREAIDIWTGVAESGRPEFEFVKTPARAQILIKWVENKGNKAWLGITHIRFNDSYEIKRSTIKVTTKRLEAEPPIEELRRVIIHEMGHALGLIGHSTYPGDIMYFSTSPGGPTEISDRDRATLRMLY